MKFRYKKILTGLIRPIIPITLQYKNNKQVYYEALVDSGADICVFPAQIGELMEIPVKTGESGPLSGITGKSETIYYHEISIGIGGNMTTTRAGFTYSKNASYGFLGQKGIFNMYIAEFKYLKETVELRPYPHIN